MKPAHSVVKAGRSNQIIDNICESYFNLDLIFMYLFQIEWICSEKGDGLRVFVDDVEVPVTVGNNDITHLTNG